MKADDRFLIPENLGMEATETELGDLQKMSAVLTLLTRVILNKDE